MRAICSAVENPNMMLARFAGGFGLAVQGGSAGLDSARVDESFAQVVSLALMPASGAAGTKGRLSDGFSGVQRGLCSIGSIFRKRSLMER